MSSEDNVDASELSELRSDEFDVESMSRQLESNINFYDIQNPVYDYKLEIQKIAEKNSVDKTSRKKKRKKRRKRRKKVSELTLLRYQTQSDIPSNVNMDDLMIYKINRSNLNYVREDLRFFRRLSNNEGDGRNNKFSIIPVRDAWRYIPVRGISMILYMKTEGVSYAKYTYDPAYSQLTQEFYDLYQLHDEESLMKLLRENPYHVESLFRVAFLLRLKNDDPSLYCEYIERALHILESSKNPNFMILSRNFKLLYNHYENRSFHLCVFCHILNIEEKCCYRSCLEFCKVLLNLDPSDPLGVLCFIDFYCLKTKSYEILIDFYEHNQRYDLNMMPNMRFSYGLAQHYVHNHQESQQAIQSALLDFPTFFHQLKQTCSIRIPNEILENHLFNQKECSPVTQTLIGIYITKMRFLFGDREILDLFLNAATDCMNTYADGVPLPNKEMKVFSTYPRSILRHAFLTKYSDPNIDKEMFNITVHPLINDPFPPLKGPNPFMRNVSLAV